MAFDIGGAFGGGLSGAATGSVFGPIGSIIGGIGGLVTGGLSGGGPAPYQPTETEQAFMDYSLDRVQASKATKAYTVVQKALNLVRQQKQQHCLSLRAWYKAVIVGLQKLTWNPKKTFILILSLRLIVLKEVTKNLSITAAVPLLILQNLFLDSKVLVLRVTNILLLQARQKLKALEARKHLVIC